MDNMKVVVIIITSNNAKNIKHLIINQLVNEQTSLLYFFFISCLNLVARSSWPLNAKEDDEEDEGEY